MAISRGETNGVDSGVRRYQVRSVSRALDILGVFSESRPELSLAEVSVRVGLDKATVFRLLRSMEERGYIAVDAKRSHYKLGPRVLQLAQVYLAGWSLRSAALPVMRRLRDEFNETVGLAVRTGHSRVFVEQAESLQSITRLLELGQPAPIYADAAGKAILAFLDESERAEMIDQLELKPVTERTVTDRAVLRRQLEEIRTQGYAVTTGERVPGVIGFAAPVTDMHGELAGSLCMSMPATRCEPARAPVLARAVIAAACEISHGSAATSGKPCANGDRGALAATHASARPSGLQKTRR